MRPGVTVQIIDTAPPRGAPTSTAVAFMVGLSEQGPLGPDLVTSLADFRRRYGARVTYGMLYDAVEAYYREGGSDVYLSRVVGPAAVASSLVLNDNAGTPVPSLKVSAMSPGVWGNNLKVEVATVTGGFTLTITRDAEVLDESPVLADKTAALDWGTISSWVDIAVAGAGGNPKTLAATPLAGGNDDHAAVTDADWLAALDRFGAHLGPGQVLAPGATSTAIQGGLLDHAGERNRVALLDAPDTGVVASLSAAAATARGAAPDNARWGEFWAPWVRIAGLAGGTTRVIAPSPIMAGMIARSDGAGNSVGTPAANLNGVTRSVVRLQHEFVDADLEALYATGVNLIKVSPFAGIMAYGDTSLADRASEPAWGGFAANRVVMAIAAQGAALLEQRVFSVIRAALLSAVAGDLLAMLGPFYTDGSLIGDTREEAYRVDVGPTVNTPETIANRELHAVIAIRTSPAAEMVELELVRVAVTESLA